MGLHTGKQCCNQSQRWFSARSTNPTSLKRNNLDAYSRTRASASFFDVERASGSKTLARCRGLEAEAVGIVGLPLSDLTTYKMILTQCAACATELGLTLGKKCGRCSTRYCGPECQKRHWEEGGQQQALQEN